MYLYNHRNLSLFPNWSGKVTILMVYCGYRAEQRAFRVINISSPCSFSENKYNFHQDTGKVICNISAKILSVPPKANLFELWEEKVLSSWSPSHISDMTGKQMEGTISEDVLESLGVNMTDCFLENKECDTAR